MPPNSALGYAFTRTLFLKFDSAGSDGMSTHAPVMSNFQPW